MKETPVLSTPTLTNAMGWRPTVSVIVPVYRNADTLQELHRRLCQVLEAQRLDFEVLFVDDACPAGSLPVLRFLTEQDSRVSVLALRNNVGQHQAVFIGLTYARGDWAVVMDADLQDPPEAVTELLAKGQAGFSAIFAGRRGRYESPWRLLTARLFRTVLHFLCGVPPDAGIFVAMDRPLRERLLTMDGPSPSIVAMIGCARLPTTSTPVERARRPTGNSAYGGGDRLKSGWRAIVWVAAWKWRALIASDRSFPASPVPQQRSRRISSFVACFIGARFQSSPLEESHPHGE